MQIEIWIFAICFVLVCAGFLVLLRRYIQQSDIIAKQRKQIRYLLAGSNREKKNAHCGITRK